MALVLKDRVQETSTTTGTGTLTLAGAVTQFQTFSAAIGNGNTTYYTIYNAGGSEWEVGLGTVGAGTLARTTVLASSNAGAAVNFTGTLYVFGDYPAGKAVFQDASGVINNTTFNATTSVITPIVQATNSGGLALKNSAGTTQISMGSGGGDNVSINVATNINGANAQIDISPTGTGHVHIKPTGTGSLEIAPTNVGTINNMTIGATTAVAGSFTNLSVTGTTSFDGAEGTAGQVLTSAGTGATPTWTTPTTGTVTSVTGTAPVVSSGGATPAISMPAATGSVNGYLTSTDWTTFNSKGSGTVTSVAATVPSFLSIAGSPITSSGTLAISLSGTALPAANGGTGLTSPGTAGFVLTSNGTGWVSQAVSPTGSTYTRTSFTATSGQTSFSVTYTVGYVEVFLNGVFLNGTEFTATNGTSVVLAVGATTGDIVETIAYNTTSVGTASTATNIAGGIASQIPYQTGAGATSFIANGTSGQVLTSNGTSVSSWTSAGDATTNIGFLNIPQNSQSAAYTLVLADSGKHILHPSADTTARTFTIPANSSVAFPIGTAITFINQNGAGVVTIAITTDTMRLSPAGTTGSRTLAANGSATAIKITSTEWLISGSGLT